MSLLFNQIIEHGNTRYKERGVAIIASGACLASLTFTERSQFRRDVIQDAHSLHPNISDLTAGRIESPAVTQVAESGVLHIKI